MVNEFEKFVLEFNSENNEFGPVDTDLIKYNSNDYQLLFYYYPMIERLIRFILDAEGIFDMENISGDTFKTLKSIIETMKTK